FWAIELVWCKTNLLPLYLPCTGTVISRLKLTGGLLYFGAWHRYSGRVKMSEAVIQEVPTERFVEATSAKELVSCHRCGSGKVRRVFREGFLQANIYPLLGYYPWRCSQCGQAVILRKRRRAKAQSGDTYRREK
ncbi:MAG: hypothetical protein ACRD3S_07935, partial [Terracidiphilus sp.]